MIQGLLQYSLERIASLQNFYDLEKKSISSRSQKGMKQNRFGFLMDTYVQLLVAGTDADREKESFSHLEQQAKQYIEIKSITSKEDGINEVQFRIKNREELEKRGFNLDIKRSAVAYRQFAEMPVIHGSNTLIMLITRFEEFIAHFLSMLYYKYPHKYLDKQQITFSEIVDIGIDEITHKIISREVDKMMRDSYVEWFKLLESHGMKLKSCQSELVNLQEIYARRNIWVHNSGQVNKSYLENVPNTTAKLGEKLPIDEQYINNAFDTIKIIIFSIHIEAIKFWDKDKNAYMDHVFNVAYEELEAEHYSICYNVFAALSETQHFDTAQLMRSKVNFWIAAKKLKGLDAIKESVESFDVSALDRVFLLAKHILLEQNGEATQIIESLFRRNDLPAYCLEEWPLFKDYRTTSEYHEFKSNHPEYFEIASVETGPEALGADKTVGKSIHEELEAAQLS